MSKKIFAFVMALALVLTFMPMPAAQHAHADASNEFECDHKLELSVDLTIATFNEFGKFYEVHSCQCGEKTQRYGVLSSLKEKTGNACVGQEVTVTSTKYPEVTLTYTDKPTRNHNWKNGKCTFTNCQMVCDHSEYDDVFVASDDAHTHMIKCANCKYYKFDVAVACSDYNDYDGKCDKCGSSIYCYGGEATCTEKAKCELCGKEYGAYADCAGGEATCTEQAICETCKKPYGTKLGHDWSNKDGKCARENCGYECEHSEYEAGKCKDCSFPCDHELALNVELTIASFNKNENSFNAIHSCQCGEKTQRYSTIPVTVYRTGNACVGQEIEVTSIDYPEITVTYTAEPTRNHNWKNGKCTFTNCQMVCGHEYSSDNADKPWLGKCIICGESHIHDGCWTGNCSICGFNLEGTHMDYYPHDGHCDNCGICLPVSDSPEGPWTYWEYEVQHDDTHHWVWHECGKETEKDVHHFDDAGFCKECEYQCDHEEFVFVHIEGTEAYESMHDWLCPDCGYVLVNDSLCYNKDENGDGICDGCKYEYDHKTHVAEKQPATCTEPAVCDACGEPFGEANGHGEYVYEHIEGTVDKGSKHKATCEDCGEVIFIEWYCSDDDEDNFCDECGVQLHTHDWSNKDGVCVTCGEACEHANDYDVISNGKGQHMLECPDCGNNFGGMLLNCENYDTDYDGVCNSCGYEIYHNWSDRDGECNNCGEKCEHNEEDKVISNGKGQHSLECPVCGWTYYDALLNCYDNDGDRFCDSCGYEVYHLHDWSNKDGICVGCGEECEHDVVNAISNGKGQHSLECAECGYTYGDMLLNCENYDSDYDGVCNSCEYEIYHTGGTPTCTEPAKCQHCGEEYVEALGHKYEVVKSEPATCGLPAYFWYECSVCGAEKNGEEGAATGEHTYEVVKSEPATCVLPAYYWYECSVCGAEKNGEEGAATGEHKYEVVKSEPATCTMPAYYWYECAECGAEMNREEGAADKTAHTYEVVKSEPATCILPAYYWYECAECGAEKNGEEGKATGMHVDANNDGKCDTCDYLFFIPCDHEGTGTYIITVEANCSNEGVVQVFCAECEELISEEILAKNDNHFFYNGKCMLCGEADECKHDFVLVKEEAATCEYPAYFWYECSKCGEEKNYEDKTGALADHKYEVVKSEAANCLYPAYYWYECSVCGAEKNGEDTTGKLGEHNYEVVKELDATCIELGYVWKECTVCGAEKNHEVAGELAAHKYEVVKSEPATCEVPAYFWYECTVCGAEKNGEDKTGKLGEHNYEVVKELDATCIELGYVWKECTVCGAEKNHEVAGELAAHKYEVVKSEPATCEAPAYYWYECSVCGAEKNGEDKTGALADHAWDEGKVTTEPTVEAEGVKTFTCTVCGETKTEAIDKIEKPEHVHDYKSVVTAPTCTEAGYTTFTCECGDSYVDDEVAAKGHKEVSANNAVEATCTTAGKKADTVCSVCGITLAEGAAIGAKGHNEVSANNAVEATCDTDGKKADTVCSVCGETLAKGAVIEAKGHKYGKPTYDFTDDGAKQRIIYTCSCGHSYYDVRDLPK